MLPNWIYGKYPQSEIIIKHIDGWVHDCGSSSELATETLHSCIKPLTQSAEIPLPILELPLDNKTVIWNNLWIVITIKVMPSIRFIILQSWSTRNSKKWYCLWRFSANEELLIKVDIKVCFLLRSMFLWYWSINIEKHWFQGHLDTIPKMQFSIFQSQLNHCWN